MVKVDRMSMAARSKPASRCSTTSSSSSPSGCPGRLKLRGLTTKWIFKKTLERLLPRENIYRKKEGFSIPIKHWLRVELRELMEDLSRARRGSPAEGLFEHGPGPAR